MQKKQSACNPFVHSLASLRPERKIALVDMDGTLSDCSHREHHIQGRRKNWGAFFRGMGQDQPNLSVVELTKRLAADHEIVIVTGRPQEYLRETMEWLTCHRVVRGNCELTRKEE